MAKKVAVLAVNPVNGCGLFQYLEALKLDLKVVKLYPLHSQDPKVILLT